MWPRSYQIWRAEDPHANAYATLWTNQSKRIIAKLSKSGRFENTHSATEVTDDEALKRNHQAAINKLCIGCHSTITAERVPQVQRWPLPAKVDSVLRDGVGCHACHSNLDQAPWQLSWIDLHTKAAWAEPNFDKAKTGLKNLTSLDHRAQHCARCHVGGSLGDVNHDLIAAGHPRLVFEFSSHLSRIPVHWIEESSGPMFNARCWSIGQTENIKASAALLKTRARSAQAGTSPWPEFSEYNCHNCHHDLQPDWYVPNSSAAQPRWRTWSGKKGLFEARSEDQFQNLQKVMMSPYPRLDQVPGLANQLAGLKNAANPVNHLFAYVQQTPELNSDDVLDWYLAVTSIDRDLFFQKDDQPKAIEFKKYLGKLFGQLAIPFRSEPATGQPIVEPIGREQLLELIEKIQKIAASQQNRAMDQIGDSR